LKQDNSSGYAALRDAAGVVDRSGTGRLVLTGVDRRTYLQGLLTNDIEALTPGTGCYAAMLNAQGRMLTDMRVLELGDRMLVDVPREVAGAIRDHLDRFIFSEDVQVDDATAAVADVGVYGPGALAVLKLAGVEGGAPARLFDSSRVRIAGRDTLLVSSDAIGIPGYDIILDAGAHDAVAAALQAAGGIHAGSGDVEVVRIESGRPRFGVDMDTETIPLEAGLDERAISRTKGCYVGQEVIVRVQDRGHGRVARRLVGLTLPAQQAVPAPGAAVSAAGKAIGRVTSAAFSPALARPVALGYVHRDFTSPGTAVVVDGSGDAAVTALPLVPLEQRD
jgi:folate-binding protein YgfZ